jgi:hypothetical protein
MLWQGEKDLDNIESITISQGIACIFCACFLFFAVVYSIIHPTYK